MKWLRALLHGLWWQPPPRSDLTLQQVEARTERLLARLEALDVDIEVIRRAPYD
jgi:hypothetical protein